MDAVGRTLIVLLLILVLFVVEGVEIAAVSLLDKDLEQIPDQRRRNIVNRLHERRKAFLTGRQAIEVSLVVMMVLLSESLFGVHHSEANQHSSELFSEGLAYALAFCLSSLIVCWYAQLLAKIWAEERPLQVINWSPTHWLVNAAILTDRLQFGAPSIGVWNLLKNRIGTLEAELLPSREKHYRSSAQLRYGMGVDEAKITIIIGEKGEVSLKARYKFQSFGPDFNNITEEHKWEAAIDPKSTNYRLTAVPVECGRLVGRRVTVSTAKFGNRVVPDGEVAWNFRFENDIPVGGLVEYEVHFWTLPGACKTAPGSDDFYQYFVRHPTRKLEVEIRPTDGATFTLDNEELDVIISPDKGLNFREKTRAKFDSHRGGPRLCFPFPHEGTLMKITWKIV